MVNLGSKVSKRTRRNRLADAHDDEGEALEVVDQVVAEERDEDCAVRPMTATAADR